VWRQRPVPGSGRRLLGLLFLVCLSGDAFAQQTDRWRFRQLQIENDNVFPKPYGEPNDRFYTNGLRVSFGRGVFMPDDESSRLPVWLRPVRRHCTGCVIYPNFSLGQSLYTPEDIENPDPQIGERPWAAWLYAGFGAAIDPKEDTRHDIEVQIGVTGDPAGGKFVQELWHKIIGSPEPAGWDNQFGPEIGINGYYTYQHVLLSAPDASVLDWDFVPSVEAAVGTIMTYAGVGGTVRIGRNITDFPYSPLRPSERRVTVSALPALEIYGFVGADIRAVAYNYFLEGSLFEDEPYAVEPKRYVWDFNFGVTARFRHWNITYAIIRRSEEFERTVGTDRGIHSFGSLSFTVGVY
jgi:lipid A 3-O-deacylase